MQFYFFSNLQALSPPFPSPDFTGKIFSTILNRSSESRHSCFIPNLRKNTLILSPLIMFAVNILQMPFIRLRKFPSVLCWEMLWMDVGLLRWFICVYWDGHIVFPFLSANMVTFYDWFQMLSQSSIPVICFTCNVLSFLSVIAFDLLNFFLRFCHQVPEGYWFIIFFSVVVCFCFIVNLLAY